MPAHRVVKVQPHEFLPSELDKCEWPASGSSHFKAGEKFPIATQQEVGWGGRESHSGYYTTTLCQCAIHSYHIYLFNLCQDVVVHTL